MTGRHHWLPAGDGTDHAVADIDLDTGSTVCGRTVYTDARPAPLGVLCRLCELYLEVARAVDRLDQLLDEREGPLTRLLRRLRG